MEQYGFGVVARQHINAVVLHFVVHHPNLLVGIGQMGRVFRHRYFLQGISLALHHDEHGITAFFVFDEYFLLDTDDFGIETQMGKTKRFAHVRSDAGDAIAVGDAADVVFRVIHCHIFNGCAHGVAHEGFYSEDLISWIIGLGHYALKYECYQKHKKVDFLHSMWFYEFKRVNMN